MMTLVYKLQRVTVRKLDIEIFVKDKTIILMSCTVKKNHNIQIHLTAYT